MTLARLAATLVAVTLLTACSDDPEPRTGPSETPSSSATQSSEPPEVLGPEETVKAWIDARNQALSDGNISAVEELTDPSCSSCRELLDSIAETYQNGGYVDSGGWRIVNSRVKSESSGKAEVRAGLRLAAGTRVPKEGADPIEFAAEDHLMVFRLANHGDAWRLTLVGFIS